MKLKLITQRFQIIDELESKYRAIWIRLHIAFLPTRSPLPQITLA